ncbi:glutathione-specific gamma-glutamylcyclotransferase 1-like [Neocloeon triangulifer]|uniref:glutathione-specific gamma-glutamylcyclotransferase 1-like n=1 Tax=Neocloeon triangulifer TaxID=2078957 RepID=UPI00286F6931|nr:glutathione-specific gamma-glutamylcyclotransferase 1-like [Neocloeon triangulifer]
MVERCALVAAAARPTKRYRGFHQPFSSHSRPRSVASVCWPRQHETQIAPSFFSPRLFLHRLQTFEPISRWVEMSSQGLWVFGYGSLCWDPGFDFEQAHIGFIKGFRRTFAQGNTHHRGTKDQPGRVATLEEHPNGIVWGRAYLLRGEAAVSYLAQRECLLGGYATHFSAVWRPQAASGPLAPEWRATGFGRWTAPAAEQLTAAALVYVATPDNAMWLGEATAVEMAEQICAAAGFSGHNADYVLNLAKFVREHCPHTDAPLLQLEAEIRRRRPFGAVLYKRLPLARPAHAAEEDRRPPSETEYSKRVPTKKLRCLNMY